MVWLRALRLLLLRPHARVAYPSLHPDFACESYDVLAVLLNQKPAALAADTPAVQDVLKHNRHHHIRRIPLGTTPHLIVSRDPDTGAALERLYRERERAPDASGFNDDPDWHRRVGTLLGYRPTDIERFVRPMQRTIDQAH